MQIKIKKSDSEREDLIIRDLEKVENIMKKQMKIHCRMEQH